MEFMHILLLLNIICNWKIRGKYPYFIGNTYRSPFINDNSILDHDFDFNNSNLLRNTLPYLVDEEFL